MPELHALDEEIFLLLCLCRKQQLESLNGVLERVQSLDSIVVLSDIYVKEGNYIVTFTGVAASVINVWHFVAGIAH